ncbi:Kinesin protein 1B [Gryganskiella cystojenkinii]|nr:Kinesin protein 1B [Gryganskiella cystojenkinii]
MLPRSSLAQGNTKSPRTTAGGLPQPGLQRRSFAPPPSSTNQSYLAEATDSTASRRRAESVGSDTSGSSGSGYSSNTFQSGGQISSNGNNNNNSVLASPLSYRSPQPRRTSVSRPGMSPENNGPFGSPSNTRAANAAYPSLSPVSTAASAQSMHGSNSPTIPADSPMVARTVRSPAGGTGVTRLTKPPQQQGFQRPTPTAGAGAGARQIATGSTSQQSALGASNLAHPQTQIPASLDNVEIGDRVAVEGIELDTPTGKNDGSVAGVQYFSCRPNCGIFVLAAKIVKTELVLPLTSAAQVHLADDSLRTPPPTQPTTVPTLQPQSRPQPEQKLTRVAPQLAQNHAAQAAARITAGSRASKYLNVTAVQLKQRNGVPQPANTRQPGVTAPLPTNELSNSPNPNRTLPSGSSATASNPQTTSPTPVAPMARTGPVTRLSQTNKTTLTGPSKLGARTRGGSITSPTATNGARPRTSPTPGRLMNSPPRRLSSRASDTAETSSTISSPNLLDQATLVQMTDAQNREGDLAVQVQQLQLEIGVAVAENNLLKTEMNQTKSQLEVTRLLEKRDLSYEERAFLSKSLGRGGIEEKLAQELEDLHAMGAVWEKEKANKDQEIKALTDKMTQAWIDAAKTQKERTSLVQEKADLERRLKDLQDHGIYLESSDSQAALTSEAKIESLQKDLEQADERIEFLEKRLEEVEGRMVSDQEEVRKTTDEAMASNQAAFQAQLGRLEQERDALQERLDDLDEVLRVTTEAMKAKLELANKDATESKNQLLDFQMKQEEELEEQRRKDSESEDRLMKSEADLRESQALLAKSERLVKSFEEKAKEHQTSLQKKEQEIADLKLELEDLSGMVQSEEVDRMRKVWENEKKRLEEAALDDEELILNLREDIHSLETNNEDLLTKIATLEDELAASRSAKSSAEAEVARLLKASTEAQERFAHERSVLETKIQESESSLEGHIAWRREKMDSLEAIISSVDEWKTRCDTMQSELIQKTALIEDANLKATEASMARKDLEDRISQSKVEYEARIESIQSTHVEETTKLQTKLSELESALAISAASQSQTNAGESAKGSSELEEEVTSLKQVVSELTRENVTVANVNKKLMLEHDNLMEAHKHVETECLKLMDEVERLHAESLASENLEDDPEDTEDDGTQVDAMENTEPKAAPVSQNSSASQPNQDKQGIVTQSQSVIRLEGLLKEKQTLLDRLTQTHATEMRDLRQRYVELDRTKAYEVSVLNKELTELESLIESKIFHEADLEEEVQRKQKQIERLQQDIADLRRQLAQATTAPMGGHGHGFGPGHSVSTNGSFSTAYMTPSRSKSSSIVSSTSSQRNSPRAPTKQQMQQLQQQQPHHDDEPLFCEICEEEGHDIITCNAVFGKNGRKMDRSSISTVDPSETEDDGRPYCENCEEFGLHYTDECPNESMTYGSYLYT